MKKLKFVRGIGKKTGKTLYEIWHGDRHVGWIFSAENNRGWSLNIETPNRNGAGLFWNHLYLKDCKQKAIEYYLGKEA